MGIFVVYFMDYIVGCGWWTMILYLLLIFAVLVVRGKPYGADQIATILFPQKGGCSGTSFRNGLYSKFYVFLVLSVLPMFYVFLVLSIPLYSMYSL